MINRSTFDGVAASYEARTRHAHNGSPTIAPGPLPAPFDHSRGLVTLDYITPRTLEGQPYFDVMTTMLIVHTDKVLRGLVFQAENRGFSPGTPPVNQPLSPGNSIALHAFAKQAARRNRDGRLKGPCVRIAVPNIDGADADEKRKEELTKQGTKRKRAPPTKGPCEHGVKQRSNCKVCSGCPHGRLRRS